MARSTTCSHPNTFHWGSYSSHATPMRRANRAHRRNHSRLAHHSRTWDTASDEHATAPFLASPHLRSTSATALELHLRDLHLLTSPTCSNCSKPHTILHPPSPPHRSPAATLLLRPEGGIRRNVSRPTLHTLSLRTAAANAIIAWVTSFFTTLRCAHPSFSSIADHYATSHTTSSLSLKHGPLSRVGGRHNNNSLYSPRWNDIAALQRATVGFSTAGI
jgi:hypothetical protein